MDNNKFLIELSESDRSDFGRVDFEKQSDEQKVFSAIWALESQVNNGGFQQYFISSDGDTANFAPTALRRIGALKCAAIVEEALRIVSINPIPANEEARQKLVEGMDVEAIEKLEALDEQFFVYPDNLTDLLFKFVHSHPEVFGNT